MKGAQFVITLLTSEMFLSDLDLYIIGIMRGISDTAVLAVVTFGGHLTGAGFAPFIPNVCI